LADRKKVAEKDGKAFRTHQVQVEDGYRVAADYELTLCEEQEIGATGRLKVVHLVPSKEESSDPCFIGRWDEKANFLDFDPVDREEHVLKDVEFMGHHPTALPDRRFMLRSARAPSSSSKESCHSGSVATSGWRAAYIRSADDPAGAKSFSSARPSINSLPPPNSGVS
jgi:hypothetical protein